MPVLPLRLRLTETPLPVAAGWLPAAGAELWLEEARRVMTLLGGDGHSGSGKEPAALTVRFYPLAVSAHDQRAAGVILTVDGCPAGTDLDRVFGPRVQRLGEVLPGVLAPVNCRLEPALSDQERRRLFAWPLHFFHPVTGLTGFEERDALQPWQLLAVPAAERAGWFAAVPGPPAPPPLRQLTLVQEMTLEEMLADGIGSDTADPSALGDPGLMDKLGGAALGALGALGAGMLSSLGGGKAAEKLEQWSRRQVEDLQNRRHRELNRLLDQFDKNPRDALRHAIPLAGAEARRGNAVSPGWKLGVRNPNLTSSSQGGGTVDVWSIPTDTRLKLERKYREAAAREAAAGHFGRAAYIHGELLGDWAQAAAMLEKAGRPREAARIYMERLRSGTRAAQCLEKAGLLAEAAVLYREAHQYEKAGDLLAALGQEDEAKALWETALLALSNPLDQARLLEGKLKNPTHALRVLQAGWPAGRQAQACFDAHLALLGRLGRHESAAGLLDRLDHEAGMRLQPASAMVTSLHLLFSQYPDFALRAKAAGLAAPFIGEALAAEPPPDRGETAKLLTLLPKFSPEDVLLSRDAARFSLTRHRPAVPLLEQSRGAHVRPDRVIRLSQPDKTKEAVWDSLTDSPDGPHVAGWLRGDLEGGPECANTLLQGPVLTKGIQTQVFIMGIPPKLTHLVMGRGGENSVFLLGNAKEARWSKPSGDSCERNALALGRGRNGEFVILVITETGTLAAEYYGLEAEPHEIRVLDYAPPGMEAGTWFTGAHGDELWLAGMEAACCVTAKGELQHSGLNGPLTGFAVAPPVLPSLAIAVGANEAVLLTPQGAGKPLECVNLFAGTQSLPPVCAFTNDGRAVIADAAGGIVYQVRGQCRKLADISLPPHTGGLTAATAIGPTGFAFLTKSGEVLCFGF